MCHNFDAGYQFRTTSFGTEAVNAYVTPDASRLPARYRIERLLRLPINMTTRNLCEHNLCWTQCLKNGFGLGSLKMLSLQFRLCPGEWFRHCFPQAGTPVCSVFHAGCVDYSYEAQISSGDQHEQQRSTRCEPALQ